MSVKLNSNSYAGPEDIFLTFDIAIAFTSSHDIIKWEYEL